MAGKNYKSLGKLFTNLSLRTTLFFLGVILFLASCRTTQKTYEEAFGEAQFVNLDQGASVYVLANAKQARPILDLLFKEEMNNKQVRNMIDKTDFFTAALFPEESGRRFQITSWGNYPSFRAGMGFSLSKSWKKKRSAEGSYWYSQSNRLSIEMSSKQAYIAALANDTPVAPKAPAPGVEIPEGFNEFSRGSYLSFWLNEPAPMFSKVLSNAGLPIRFPVQRLFVSLSAETAGQYEAVMRLKFENASQARGMAAIFNLAGNFASGGSGSIIASIFFANAPVQDGLFLDIKTAVLSENDLSLLFQMFLLN